ncbi:hypothetical protein F5148DRAFT_1151771 [Russula earlei]|uniref:Uncharacterized protein n=1 Tax=Russula earlei TaxID=71964 RepID=A0ACC0TZT7_9AGAM|nr:hypothetical protein F5148DRAFT_1151771 [Russula earlei]
MAQDDTDSESGTGMPEIVSLSTSASAAKGHDRALRSLHAAQKRMAREKNRRCDEYLKVQANNRRRFAATTGKGKHKVYAGNHGVEAGDNEGGRDMDPRLHWRMTRAMGEAEEEWEETVSRDASEEWGGIEFADEDLQAPEQTLEMSSGENRDGEKWAGETRDGHLDSGGHVDGRLGTSQTMAPSSKYLPDHVFVTAPSERTPENGLRRSQTMPKTRFSRKRRSAQACTKDVVVGIRTIRTLISFPKGTHSHPSGISLPPARINKFLANALGLKERSKRTPTFIPRWERRPPFLGVLKRTCGAPLTGFAHSSSTSIGATSIRERY